MRFYILIFLITLFVAQQSHSLVIAYEVSGKVKKFDDEYVYLESKENDKQESKLRKFPRKLVKPSELKAGGEIKIRIPASPDIY